MANNPTNYFDPLGLYRSPEYLRYTVPGQVQFDYGMTAWEDGRYGWAAAHFTRMVGEQIVFALTFGQTGAMQKAGQCAVQEATATEIAANSAGLVGREIKLVDGFYQAKSSAFKFSKYYYEHLWATGRGAPFIQAEEVIATITFKVILLLFSFSDNLCSRNMWSLFTTLSFWLWFFRSSRVLLESVQFHFFCKFL